MYIILLFEEFIPYWYIVRYIDVRGTYPVYSVIFDHQVPLSTKLRIPVKTESHSPMSHDLGNVGFVLDGKRLLFDTQAFACLGKCSGN